MYRIIFIRNEVHGYEGQMLKQPKPELVINNTFVIVSITI